ADGPRRMRGRSAGDAGSEPDGWDLTAKPATDSAVRLSRIMDLTDANRVGNVHGGEIVKSVDTTGGLAAMKHCGGPVVTVAMDEMSFLEPAYVGDLLTVKAMVNDTGRTSMEVGVRVEAENVVTGRRVHTSSAYLVYVALDRSGKPRPVPPVIVEDEDQRRRQVEAKLRREARLAPLGALEHRATRARDARRPGRGRASAAPDAHPDRLAPGGGRPGGTADRCERPSGHDRAALARWAAAPRADPHAADRLPHEA